MVTEYIVAEGLITLVSDVSGETCTRGVGNLMIERISRNSASQRFLRKKVVGCSRGMTGVLRNTTVL